MKEELNSAANWGINLIPFYIVISILAVMLWFVNPFLPKLLPLLLLFPFLKFTKGFLLLGKKDNNVFFFLFYWTITVIVLINTIVNVIIDFNDELKQSYLLFFDTIVVKNELNIYALIISILGFLFGLALIKSGKLLGDIYAVFGILLVIFIGMANFGVFPESKYMHYVVSDFVLLIEYVLAIFVFKSVAKKDIVSDIV